MKQSKVGGFIVSLVLLVHGTHCGYLSSFTRPARIGWDESVCS